MSVSLLSFFYAVPINSIMLNVIMLHAIMLNVLALFSDHTLLTNSQERIIIKINKKLMGDGEA